MQRKTLSGIVVAAALVVAGTTAPFAFADEDPGIESVPLPDTELRVLSWNICGEAGGSRGDAGYCPYRNEPDVKVDQIVGMVDEYDLNVILLQEVCGESPDSHLGLLETALGEEWTIGRASGARPDGRTDCRGDLTGELGVGIAVKATDAEFDSQNTVPAGGDEQTLPILCATTSQWTTKVCTVHILAKPEDPRRPGQIDNVRDYVWDDRDDLVLGGDFNMFPDSEGLDPIYGSFDECDRRSYHSGDTADEDTHHAWTNGDHVYRKRDHIFTTQVNGTRFTFCDSRTDLMDETANEADSGPPTGYSDHAPLIAKLTV